MRLRTIFLGIIELLCLIHFVGAMPKEELVHGLQGFEGVIMYSGYLDTTKSSSKLHYILIESQVNVTEAPLVLWLNGGPGCSSIHHMMTSLGPYLLPKTGKYKRGDPLIKNQFSWSKVANMLYIDSPAIVGFSTDKIETEKTYTDAQTAADLFQAVTNFLFQKGPQFLNRSLYITGVSYGSKYGADLAMKILQYNQGSPQKPIKLIGMLIGNGVMNLMNLFQSQVEFLIEQDILSNRLVDIYQHSCQNTDFSSPRCQFVKQEVFRMIVGLSYFNIYVVCKETFNLDFSQQKSIRTHQETLKKLFLNGLWGGSRSQQSNTLEQEIGQCKNDNATEPFYNLYKKEFHVQGSNKTYYICAPKINYQMSPTGSMSQYNYILDNAPKTKIWYYSGDADLVIPVHHSFDTVDSLGLSKVGDQKAWFYNEQLAGFYQQYQKNVSVITVKAAGHVAVNYKWPQMYQMFYNFIKDRPINTPVF